jgi:hypothetical protein
MVRYVCPNGHRWTDEAAEIPGAIQYRCDECSELMVKEETPPDAC